MSGEVATAEVDVRAGRVQVWSALTDPEQVAGWMAGSRVETTWEVGSPITWQGEFDGHSYTDKGEVLVVDEPDVLSVTHYSPLMGEQDVPGSYHTLVYTLGDASGGTTRLTLTQDGCTDAAQAEQFSASWQQMLDGLKAHVEQGGTA